MNNTPATTHPLIKTAEGNCAMQPKWKWLAICTGTLIISIAGLGFDIVGGPTIVREYINHEKPKNLSFSFSRCTGSASTPQAVESMNWSGDTLTVDTTITPNCGTTWLFGSYKIVNENELILGYKTISPALVACNCDFKAIYKISELDKKDYKVTITEYAFINEYPKSVRMLLGDISPDIIELEEW